MKQKVPERYKPLFRSIKRKAKRHNVKLRFSHAKTVYCGKDDVEGSSGYFTRYELAVATDVPLYSWLQVLVHESCHMDQEFDKRIPKDVKKRWDDASYAFCEWLGGRKQCNKSQLERIINSVVEMELDCEKRSIAKIKKWQLPIHQKQYIQCANVYLYCHQIYKELRSFFSTVELASDEDIYKLAH